jgi:hypothetical protein
LGDQETGDLYVLSIGVEPNLTAAGKRDPYAGDAWFVREALARAEPVYATTHSRVLAGPRAARADVLDALSWLATSLRERDVAIVFFSAHGSIAPPGAVPGHEGFYIDLAGAAPGKDCVLWGSELNGALEHVRGRSVLLVDTCSAEAVIPADGHSSGDDDRVAVLASCKSDESSSGQWARADRPHGWFVIALCEALAGSADVNGNGIVTLRELTSYVPDRARQLYGKQDAVVHAPDSLYDLPLSRTDPNHPAAELWSVSSATSVPTRK